MKSLYIFLMASLLCILISGSILANDPLFQARIEYSVEGNPAVADLDGDGDNDLAVAGTGDAVIIMLNNGNGTFVSTATYGIGSGAGHIVCADLDGDNDIDLTVSSHSNLFILLNYGDGTFAPPISTATEDYPQSMFSADLDGDGDNDLAMTLYDWTLQTGKVSILLNNGDGTFAAPAVYLEDSRLAYLYGADLDGDGDCDLAIAHSFGQSITVLLNDGDATFSESANYHIGRPCHSILVTDVDGDGDNDVAAGCGYNIAIVLNNGDATFSDPILYPTHVAAYSIDASDIDDDGDHDLVAANGDIMEFNSDRVSALLNNGDGTFALPVIIMTGRSVWGITLADLDGDNDDDLVGGIESVFTLFNNGDGTFPGAVRIGGGRGAACTADFDGDGNLDLARTSWHIWEDPWEWPPEIYESCGLSILMNNGNGLFLSNHVDAQVCHANSIFAADFDGDGDYDLSLGIEAGYLSSAGLRILSNNGDGTFAEEIDYATGANVTSVCGADLDDDGDIDLAATGAGILLNNGDGTFAESIEPLPGNDIISADLDGDNDQDLVIGRSSSILILRNNGDATFEATSLDGLVGDDVVSADFDNDGDYDLAVADYDDVNISIMLNNGDATFANPIDYYVGIFPHDIFTADLNGDGNYDLALAGANCRSTDFFSSFASVLINNGDATFEATYDYGLTYWGIDELLGVEGLSPAEVWITGADFDGDGDVDLAADGYILFNQSGCMPGTISAGIDIKPGSCPNPLNVPKKDKGNAVLPVAILGTDDFDVRDIFPESITLNGVSPVRWGYEDVSTPVNKDIDSCACTEDGPDGFEDLTLKFDREAIIASLNTTPTDEQAAVTAVAKSAFHAENNFSNAAGYAGQPAHDSYILRVEGILSDGSAFDGYDCIVLMTRGEVAVKPLDETRRGLELMTNHPNPFNPVTRIGFYLPEAGDVRLEVYNVLGQRVAILIDQRLEPGDYALDWDGSGCASGVYFYRFVAGDYVATKKMLLLK